MRDIGLNEEDAKNQRLDGNRVRGDGVLLGPNKDWCKNGLDGSKEVNIDRHEEVDV